MDKQVQELLNAKIIAPSDASRWCSPIVMVRKPSGEFRFCADLRRLNSQCETLYHELPNVEDVVDLVSQNQAKIFTVCDLRQAFYQLSLTDESIEKTTFSVSHGNFYKFLKLPMGYVNSPYHCTQALNKLFRHQIGDFMLIYVDDILISSSAEQAHLGHLRIMLMKLREANLKLQPTKCQLARPELTNLGHVFFFIRLLSISTENCRRGKLSSAPKCQRSPFILWLVQQFS